jgi:multimeric flavodoxin WrbA
MKKREFLKAAGLIGATLVVREGAGALVKSAKSNKGKKGASDIQGCVACGSCHEEEANGCVYATADEKKWIVAMQRADAIILASPTYFGGIAGTMKSFLDKAFFANSKDFQYKIGASVVTTPRSGASMTFESLNQYLTIAQMTVASSTYWNNVRGLTVADLQQDGEGIRTMQNLAKNIVKLI